MSEASSPLRPSAVTRPRGRRSHPDAPLPGASVFQHVGSLIMLTITSASSDRVYLTSEGSASSVPTLSRLV